MKQAVILMAGNLPYPATYSMHSVINFHKSSCATLRLTLPSATFPRRSHAEVDRNAVNEVP